MLFHLHTFYDDDDPLETPPKASGAKASKQTNICSIFD